MVSRGCTPGLSRAARRHGRQEEAGYNLVILVVIITLLNIVIAKALPLWSAIIQREKEEELIFRGTQYAEAIRVYEQRTGGLPTKLEQLIELEPRCIRQLWTNPFAEDGSWELILPGQGRQRPGGRNRNLGLDRDEDEDENQDPNQNPSRDPNLPGDPSKPNPSLLWVPGAENKIGAVPIFGVKSSVGGESIKLFVTNPNAPGGGGSNEIREWLFTADVAKALITQPDPSKPILPSMNVAQRFRPWPPNVRPINVPSAPRPERQRRQNRGGKGVLDNPGQRNQPDG